VTIIPSHNQPNAEDFDKLLSILQDKRVLVLSGAGISTDSGIPDYRGPDRKRPAKPMRYQEFVNADFGRQRYWSRSMIGWATMGEAKPNQGHKAIAAMEKASAVFAVLTQNVDGLHQAAGSKSVLELHGSLALVRCLECSKLESRRKLQVRMRELNPNFEAEALEIAPDGDAEIRQHSTEAFVVPSCLHCDGMLKPDVVFFGENVPKKRVEKAWSMFDFADVLLVVGSSLTVFSGYRFVKKARALSKPVVILNQGETRGDDDATLKLEYRLGALLPELARKLTKKVPSK